MSATPDSEPSPERGGESGGTLLLAGGGKLPPALAAAFIAAAGGAEARIVLLAHCSDEPEQTALRAADFFRESGARNIATLTDADSASVLLAFAEARGVWITGGDQNRFTARFPSDTGVPDALRAVYGRGGVVGGTSAGASLIGERMPTGEETEAQGVRRGACPNAPALNLLPHAIVDQHFLIRHRLQRLLTAVLDNPGLFGIGIEEEAWATIQDGVLTVGGGQVVLLTVPGAISTQDRTLGADDVRLRLLLSGATAMLPAASD